MKPKICFQDDRGRWNSRLMRDRCDVVYSRSKADLLIARHYDPNFPVERTVMVQSEPPISRNVVKTYRSGPSYHTWGTFSERASNVVPFTLGPDCAIGPYRPAMNSRVLRNRDDLQPKGRGAYFAGHRPNYADRSQCGARIVYGRRAEWARAITRALGGVCLGEGWPQSSKYDPRGWAAAKFAELAEGDFDFVLCFENCLYPRYHSEKFWHGLLSDRVTVYMGHEDIKAAVDPRAYVYADDFEDVNALIEYLRAMTPEEYRSICVHARAVLDGIKDRPREVANDFTERLIERINA